MRRINVVNAKRVLLCFSFSTASNVCVKMFKISMIQNRNWCNIYICRIILTNKVSNILDMYMNFTSILANCEITQLILVNMIVSDIFLIIIIMVHHVHICITNKIILI